MGNTCIVFVRAGLVAFRPNATVSSRNRYNFAKLNEIDANSGWLRIYWQTTIIFGRENLSIDIHSDEELMRQVQHGEQSALAALYDRHSPIALGLIIKILGDRAASEEVLQELFWRVWDRADNFDSARGKFTTWMFSITRRMAIDALRKRQVRPQPLERQSAEFLLDLQSAEIDVMEEVSSNLAGEAVIDALQVLPDEQREVIEKAYFEGKTRREIAVETDVPLGTVHTRARLGLQRLRQTLSGRGMGGDR